MSTNAKTPSPGPKKKRSGKKKTDPFWPIVIILSILAFTGSFWFFYMLTSKINTRSFSTTDTPKLMLTPTPDMTLEGSSMMVGDNATQTTPAVTSTPDLTILTPANESPAATPPATPAATQAPSAQPTPRITPTPLPTRTPRPAPSTAPTQAPAATATTAYRVQVGAYNSREAAQQAVGQLAEKGYTAQIAEENGRYRVQLGVFENQDRALSLAEEVTQQGYEVVVRKVTL